MVFKINKRTRIMILLSVLENIQKLFPPKEWFYDFLSEFCKEAGLVRTSLKRKFSKLYAIYFAVEDKHKYMLAKIKYGF